MEDRLLALKVHGASGARCRRGHGGLSGVRQPRHTPDSGDVDDWVNRTVLNPTIPLCGEARHLPEEETEVPETALYHSILAAVAAGNNNLAAISSYVGKDPGDHPPADGP